MNKDILVLFKKIPNTVEFFPDLKLFKKTMFAINPTGDPNEAYRLLQFRLDEFETNQTKSIEEGEMTFKYLMEKYDKYVMWWESEFGNKDPQYISKADRLMNLESWFENKGYNKFYSKQITHLDTYLFGGFSEAALDNKIAIFNKLIGKQEDGEPISEEQFETAERPKQGTDFTPDNEDPFSID